MTRSVMAMQSGTPSFSRTCHGAQQEGSYIAGQATEHSWHRFFLRQAQESQDSATKVAVCQIRSESQTPRAFLRDKAEITEAGTTLLFLRDLERAVFAATSQNNAMLAGTAKRLF